MKVILVALAGAVAVVPSYAQTTVSLTKPVADFPEPFTSVIGVRELPSGKVLVSDNRDKVVQLIDFGSGQTVKVGREGQGPGEYALPMGLYARPGGETWIHDVLGRRFLVVDAQGKPTTTVSLPGSGPGGIAIGGGGAGTDSKGRYYFQAPPFSIGNPNAPPPDSTAILRWDGTSESIDTVAYFVGPKATVSAGGGGRQQRLSVTIGGGKVFTPSESWGVAADGSIARVIPQPYRVAWYPATSGAAVVGPTQAYTPIRVTAADKAEVIEARKRNPGMQIRVGNGGRATSGGAPPQQPDPEFEETKPPFGGNNAVLVTPEGEVWVRRYQQAGAKNPIYDVFDRAGKLARKVQLNPRSNVVGFGKGTVYVVRSDEDDLQYLERYSR